MNCPRCKKEMHWHGEPILGFLCDDCDGEILDRILQDRWYE